MKILFVNACGPLEGDINHALLVLRNLAKDVKIVVATIPRGQVATTLRELPGVGTVESVEMGGSELPSDRRRRGAAGEASEFVAGLQQIASLARRENVDLICSIDRTVSAYLSAITARITGKPFVLMAAYPFYGNHRKLNRMVLRAASCIISHSQYLTGHLTPYVKDPNRIVTIPDPLDATPYLGEKPEAAKMRAQWEVPPSGKVILLAGRINQYKGHNDFVRAAAIVVRSRPKTRFLICGRHDPEQITIDDVTGTFEEHVMLQIQDLGVGEQVRFLGYIADLKVAMCAADIIAMPSKEEPYGLVALEGMAAGKPVVSTRAGGVPEFVIHEQTGLLVPPSDPRALADAFIKLLSDPAAAEEMGRRGRERVLTQYTVAGYIQKLMPVLERVVARSRMTAAT